MKLVSVLEYLASGELANLNLAEDRKNIKPDKMVIVLRNINRGLEDLHTRFSLKVNYAEVDTVLGVNQYTVVATDLVEILHIYVNGKKLNETEYRLLSTNSFKLNIVLGITDNLRVEYKANHRQLTELDVELGTNIDLPSAYVNALIYFIAARLFTGAVNQLDGDLNEGVAYERKYQDEIIMLNNQGIDVEHMDTDERFASRGFA